jgi:putative ABC transport system permease protein
MPWKLLLRNVLGHKVRSLLTVGAVFVAVFLVCVLQALTSGLTRTLDASAANRLLVQSAVSLFVDLPLSYQQKLAAVAGVDAICKWQWFGGRYEQDKGGFFAQFGIDPEPFLPSYPEMTIVEGSYDDFVATRTGCIIGRQLAEKYGWEVGARVPINGTIFTRLDGSPWEFEVNAIYESSSPAFDEQQMFFQFAYIEESLEQGGATGPDGCGLFMLKLGDGVDPISVQRAVDDMFENGPQRVQTTTEAEFNRQFISMLGDVPQLLSLIGGAVLFAIFFAVLNTMLLTGRERTRDLGVMKALGFGNGVAAGLLIGESLLLCATGAGLAVAVALGLEQTIAESTAAFIPGFALDGATLTFGAGVALAVGLVSGALPGLRAARMDATTALQEIV